MKLKAYSPIKNAEEQQGKKNTTPITRQTDIQEWWEFWLSNEK